MAHRLSSVRSTASSLSSIASTTSLPHVHAAGNVGTSPPSTPTVIGSRPGSPFQQNVPNSVSQTGNNNVGGNAPTAPSNVPPNIPAVQGSQPAISNSSIPSQGGKHKSSIYSRYFDDWWAWEILSGLLGTLCLLSIVIVLAVLDGKPQPEMRWGITLNAVIALITTIMKGALLTPLMECMSQFKWIAFARNERPLTDFDVYDGASRGGLSALRLCWHMRKRFWREVTALAALFYFLSFGVDTFVQQLIQNQYQDSVISTSVNNSLLRSQRYDSYSQLAEHQGSIEPEGLDPDMSAAIYVSLYTTRLPVQDLFSCSTSNCTYPPTPSLAVCGECHNLTSEVIEFLEYGVEAYRLPQGGPEVGSLVAMNVTATDDASKTVSFNDSGPIIAAFAYINTTNTIGSHATAGECALYLCVQEYESKVENNLLNQTVAQNWTYIAPRSITNNQTIADGAGTGNWSYYDDIKIDTQGMNGSSAGMDFNVSIKAFLAMRKIIPPLLQGNVTTSEHGYEEGLLFSSDIMQRLYNTPDMAALIDSVSSLMTSSIRRNPSPYVMADYNHPSETDPRPNYTIPAYAGSASRNVPFVRIVWPWIVLPAITVLFSNVFLIYAIIRTRQAQKHLDIGVWRSSCLPVLYHGLDADTLTRAGVQPSLSTSVATMEENANQLRVRLRLVKNEVKLS